MNAIENILGFNKQKKKKRRVFFPRRNEFGKNVVDFKSPMEKKNLVKKKKKFKKITSLVNKKKKFSVIYDEPHSWGIPFFFSSTYDG